MLSNCFAELVFDLEGTQGFDVPRGETPDGQDTRKGPRVCSPLMSPAAAAVAAAVAATVPGH